MTTMDAFTAQIVQLVREMPDEAILALVKNQLGAVFGTASLGGARKASGRAASAPAPRASAKRGRRAGKRRAARRVAKPRAAAPPKAKKVRVVRARKAAGSKAAKAAKAAPTRVSADRQSLVGTVERVVKSGSGMSASQVAAAARAPQTRVANALKELKLAKRIFQGGDRRFARYAGDPRTASQASETARKTASGPLTKKKGKR